MQVEHSKQVRFACAGAATVLLAIAAAGVCQESGMPPSRPAELPGWMDQVPYTGTLWDNHLYWLGLDDFPSADAWPARHVRLPEGQAPWDRLDSTVGYCTTLPGAAADLKDRAVASAERGIYFWVVVLDGDGPVAQVAPATLRDLHADERTRGYFLGAVLRGLSYAAFAPDASGYRCPGLQPGGRKWLTYRRRVRSAYDHGRSQMRGAGSYIRRIFAAMSDQQMVCLEGTRGGIEQTFALVEALWDHRRRLLIRLTGEQPGPAPLAACHGLATVTAQASLDYHACRPARVLADLHARRLNCRSDATYSARIRQIDRRLGRPWWASLAEGRPEREMLFWHSWQVPETLLDHWLQGWLMGARSFRLVSPHSPLGTAATSDGHGPVTETWRGLRGFLAERRRLPKLDVKLGLLVGNPCVGGAQAVSLHRRHGGPRMPFLDLATAEAFRGADGSDLPQAPGNASLLDRLGAGKGSDPAGMIATFSHGPVSLLAPSTSQVALAECSVIILAGQNYMTLTPGSKVDLADKLIRYVREGGTLLVRLDQLVAEPSEAPWFEDVGSTPSRAFARRMEKITGVSVAGGAHRAAAGAGVAVAGGGFLAEHGFAKELSPAPLARPVTLRNLEIKTAKVLATVEGRPFLLANQADQGRVILLNDCRNGFWSVIPHEAFFRAVGRYCLSTYPAPAVIALNAPRDDGDDGARPARPELFAATGRLGESPLAAVVPADLGWVYDAEADRRSHPVIGPRMLRLRQPEARTVELGLSSLLRADAADPIDLLTGDAWPTDRHGAVAVRRSPRRSHPPALFNEERRTWLLNSSLRLRPSALIFSYPPPPEDNDN
jgi:hypothetical protein